jgi:3-oxoacyl-[acyl-carrier-protein] synthase III
MGPSFKFSKVCLESIAVNLPPNKVTSAELEQRLAPLYQNLGIPFGTLERLSGISSRYFWDHDMLPSKAGTVSAKEALEQSGLSKDQVNAVINCSVTRDYFEPATACLIHANLGLPETSLALDFSNACIGFSNGIQYLGQLIESGVVQAGIIVSAETVAPMIDSTIVQLLNRPDINREELLKVLPTLTVGSGAVAMVLCHESISKNKHRVIGSIGRSQTEHCNLCAGNADYQVSGYSVAQDADFSGSQAMMITESAKLISSAAILGGRVFKDFTSTFGWNKDDMQHIFCHQVGRQINSAFYEEMDLDIEKEYTIYKHYGNMVSAALPTALALGIAEKTANNSLKSGDKILLTAFGSGLNAIFTGIEW